MSTTPPTGQPTPQPTAQPGPQPGPTFQPATPKRMVRRRDDRMVAGVCAGAADYLGMDVSLVRVLTVLGAVLGFGSLIVAYVVAWLLLPEE